jgi:hypothetical protein
MKGKSEFAWVFTFYGASIFLRFSEAVQIEVAIQVVTEVSRNAVRSFPAKRYGNRPAETKTRVCIRDNGAPDRRWYY